MKDIALQIIKDEGDNKTNILREYLQNYLLFLMYKTGMSDKIFFVGGTALRFLYRIKRFSEDLDFSAGDKWSDTDLSHYMKIIERELIKSGYQIQIKIDDKKNSSEIKSNVCFCLIHEPEQSGDLRS